MTFTSNTSTANCPSKAELIELARSICQQFNVPKAYFARIIGNRHHFLAGYGAETFLPATKISLHPQLCLFVEGSKITPSLADSIRSFVNNSPSIKNS
ncbi:MAG: hypothetical protein GX489_03120 [Firmicutes bacterium]|nr:hypothetical protein [Bacillota bacterium]